MGWLKHIFQSKETKSRGLIKHPFPPLTKDVFGGGSLFHWAGKVHLSSWKGFAAEGDLTPDGWSSPNPRPDGDLNLSIDPVDMEGGSEPTDEQARAFQHLLHHEEAMRDAVLSGIFEDYPSWRASYYGAQISDDGGKTYRSASEFPDMYRPENMPEISQPRDLMRLIRPHTIHVLSEAKDGLTEVGFEFACKWDEEHGLGVLTHRTQVIRVGDASESF